MSRNIALLIALIVTAALASTAVTAAPGSQNGPSKLHPGKANTNPNVTVSNYEDWKVLCPKSNQSQAPCKMTQLVKSPKTGKPIMRVVMAYPPKINGAAMIFVTPLGTRLAPGLTFRVGNGKAHHIPFQICLKHGCRADYPINGSLLATMKQGLTASVELVGPRGRKINLDISLQGFTAANRKIHP